MKYLLSLIFLYFLSIKYTESIDCEITPKNNESRLKQAILCKYDNTHRPVLNENTPILIKVKLILKGFDFSDSVQQLTISSWLSMQWTDEHLKWDAREYNNIDAITEMGDSIWQPKLGVYNSDIYSTFDDPCKIEHCNIKATGVISCIPPCSHTASCVSNFENWPYDTQNCSIHIGTWLHSGEEINFTVLKPTVEDTTAVSRNQEWSLIEMTYRRNDGNYTNNKIKYDNTYPSITYSFTMARHTAVHAAVIIGPAIMLFVINTISLWIDPGCGERFSVNGLSLLVHFLYLQQVSWFVPKDGDRVPNVIILFRDSMIISGILLINTVILRGITFWHFNIPSWIHSTVTFVSTNKFGEYILIKNLLEKRSYDQNSLDDNVHLVESQQTVGESVQQQQASANKQSAAAANASSSPWITFAKIIDRIMFIIIFITYMIMILKFIPIGSSSSRIGSFTSDKIIGY